MKTNARNGAMWLAVLATVTAVAGVALSGCSSKQGTSEAPAATSQATPEATMPSAEAEHGEAGEAVKPAGSIAGIWTQIGEEQAKLSAAIGNGQLKDVHHLAFGIRDFVVALADQAKQAAPATAPQLAPLVEQVKASAAKLDELGDAGNLSGTQAEYAKLGAILTSIKAIAGGQ